MKKSEVPSESEIEYIVKKYSEMLFKICFIMLCNEQDAEDAVQNTFYKYINKNKQFNDFEHEKAWLIRVATNCCKDILRFNFKHRVINLDEISNNYRNESEDNKEILEMVLNLPAKYKAPLYLFYFENYKTNEIAEILSISPAAARKRLQYGRDILKIELGDE
jgi:RNA polymerase sigma factor (sigma-70 family)